jgi:hypothetical protein
MDTLKRTASISNLLVERERETLEVFGPEVQFIVAPQSGDEAPCVIKGTIPPGVSVSKLGRFFQEIRRSVTPGERVSPPSANDIQRFLQIAGRYDYWLATPEENAAVGISLF